MSSTAKVKKESRVRKVPKHHSFRLSRKNIRPTYMPMPSSWWIFKKSASNVWKYKKLYVGIAAIYAVSTIAFVRGIDGGFDIVNLFNLLRDSGSSSKVADGLTIVRALFINVGDVPNEISAFYQFSIFVIISLAVIWSLRHTRKNEKVTLKQSFYSGMTALVPFSLIVILLLSVLLPLTLADLIYRSMFIQGIATTFLEQFLWALLIGLIIILCIYLFVTSLFSIYIVTVPGINPTLALRSSRNIVRFRIFEIIRKLLFLPFILAFIATVLLLPTIIFVPAAAEPLYYMLIPICFILMHSYLYNLYRELL